jgi:dUTP pyrophosphatase
MSFMHDPNFQYMPVLKFVKNHPDAKLPTKNHETDAGWDVYSVEDKILKAKSATQVSIGIRFADIPQGYWIEPRSRSGLMFKHGIRVFNGTIDSGFIGNAGILLINESDIDYEVKKGDRIAQLAIHFNIHMKVDWGEVTPSARGSSGFGGSGR